MNPNKCRKVRYIERPRVSGRDLLFSLNYCVGAVS